MITASSEHLNHSNNDDDDDDNDDCDDDVAETWHIQILGSENTYNRVLNAYAKNDAPLLRYPIYY